MSFLPACREPFVSNRVTLVGIAAVGEYEAGDRRVGGAGAQEDYPGIAELLAGQLERVEEPRERDAGGPLSVVVPHRDIAGVPQLVEDPEAVRLGYVLQVHRPEGILDHLHEIDDLGRIVLPVGAARVDAERHRVHAAQVFHQEGLALHHAQAPGRRAVPIAQDPRRVRHDCHQVTPVGQGEGAVVVVTDIPRYGGNAGSVPDVEPIEAPEPAHRHGLHFAAEELVSRQG